MIQSTIEQVSFYLPKSTYFRIIFQIGLRYSAVMWILKDPESKSKVKKNS